MKWLIVLIIMFCIGSCKSIQPSKHSSVCETEEYLFNKISDKQKVNFTKEFINSDTTNLLCLSFQIAYYEKATGINASCEKGGGGYLYKGANDTNLINDLIVWEKILNTK
ncbi:MAG: hypothetical protein ABI723_06495 [Bacteroidia bacterium]